MYSIICLYVLYNIVHCTVVDIVFKYNTLHIVYIVYYTLYSIHYIVYTTQCIVCNIWKVMGYKICSMGLKGLILYGMQ